MKFTDRRVGNVAVVDMDGKLVGGADTEGFHGLIKRLLSAGEKRIVINLERTPWATSQGIGLLIGAFTSVSNAGGRLVLAQVPSRLQETLRVTRLTLIFELFSTLDDAIAAVTTPGDDGGAARIGGHGTIRMA